MENWVEEVLSCILNYTNELGWSSEYLSLSMGDPPPPLRSIMFFQLTKKEHFSGLHLRYKTQTGRRGGRRKCTLAAEGIGNIPLILQISRHFLL